MLTSQADTAPLTAPIPRQRRLGFRYLRRRASRAKPSDQGRLIDFRLGSFADRRPPHPPPPVRARGSSMHAAQSGMIVLELQLTAVQASDCRRKAQAQSRARLRPALLKAHEALDDPVAIGFGNAGAVIRNRQRDVIAFVLPALTTISAGSPLSLAAGPAYLMALSTRLASAWLDQFAIAAHRRR